MMRSEAEIAVTRCISFGRSNQQLPELVSTSTQGKGGEGHRLSPCVRMCVLSKRTEESHSLLGLRSITHLYLVYY